MIKSYISLALLAVLVYSAYCAQLVPVLNINCGGGGFTDSAGKQWSSDSIYNSGGRKTLYSPRPITNASNTRLYYSQRWSADATQPLSYSLPVANGNYQVKLHFIEFDEPTDADTQFIVKANGEQVAAVKITQEATGVSKALVKSFDLTVTTGAIQLEFVAGTASAKINAIEVYFYDEGAVEPSTPVDPQPSNPPPSNPPPSNPPPSNPPPSNPPPSGPADATFVPPAEVAVHRINCGAVADYTDKRGQVWEKDRDFYGATNIDRWTLPFKYVYAAFPEVQQNFIENTFSDEDVVLYTNERWSSGNWGYRLATPRGRYLVRLYFAEWYHGNFELFDWNYRTKGLRGIGVRVFSVQANGQTVIPRVDVFQEVGPFAALRKEFWVDVGQDGTLDIAFNRIAESPMCNAIEVIAEANVISRQRLPAGRQPGLLVQYYDYNPGSSQKLGHPEQVDQPMSIMPKFDNEISWIGVVPYFNNHATIGRFHDTPYEIQFAAIVTGWLRVPEAGKYKITIESNDGSIMDICDDDGLSWNAGECLTISNDGNHQNLQVTRDFDFKKAGFYRIRIRYFQGFLLTCLRLFWMKEAEYANFQQYYYVGKAIPQDFLSHDPSEAALVLRSVNPNGGPTNGGTPVTLTGFVGFNSNKDNTYVREIHPCLPSPGYKQIKANVVSDNTLTFTTQGACYGMGSVQVVVLDTQGNVVKQTNRLQYFFN